MSQSLWEALQTLYEDDTPRLPDNFENKHPNSQLKNPPATVDNEKKLPAVKDNSGKNELAIVGDDDKDNETSSETQEQDSGKNNAKIDLDEWQKHPGDWKWKIETVRDFLDLDDDKRYYVVGPVVNSIDRLKNVQFNPIVIIVLAMKAENKEAFEKMTNEESQNLDFLITMFLRGDLEKISSFSVEALKGFYLIQDLYHRQRKDFAYLVQACDLMSSDSKKEKYFQKLTNKRAIGYKDLLETSGKKFKPLGGELGMLDVSRETISNNKEYVNELKQTVRGTIGFYRAYYGEKLNSEDEKIGKNSKGNGNFQIPDDPKVFSKQISDWIRRQRKTPEFYKEFMKQLQKDVLDY